MVDVFSGDSDVDTGESAPKKLSVSNTTEHERMMKGRGKYKSKGGKGVSKQKMLNKTEKATVMKVVGELSARTLTDYVEEKVTGQLSEPDLSTFKALLHHEAIQPIVEFHHSTFMKLYTQHNKGKEKYVFFQLDWYKHCSIFLVSKELSLDCVFPSASQDVIVARQVWLNFLEFESAHTVNYNKLMILISSALYERMLCVVHSSKSQQSCEPSVSSDGDDVYFRFGGATLCSMLHVRYKGIKRCASERRDILSKEIQILQSVNTKDKEKMPQYLKYRDMGNMYSPHEKFIPFFREVDECIKKVANEVGLQQHGDDLVEVAHSTILEKTSLKECFIGYFDGWNMSDKVLVAAMDNIYMEMIRKLCNTRIKEFFTSYSQKVASNKGKASTAGQNLRDTLLTQHTHLQSRVKID